ATVLGNGQLTVRRRGASRAYPAGSVVGFAELAAESPTEARPEARAEAGADPVATAAGAGTAPDRPNSSLRADTEEQVKRFDAALAARDVDGCVAAVLDLEQALQDWIADTDVSDE